MVKNYLTQNIPGTPKIPRGVSRISEMVLLGLMLAACGGKSSPTTPQQFFDMINASFANGNLTVDMQNPAKHPISVVVTDSEGKVVLDTTHNNPNDPILPADFQPGDYTVTVTHDEESDSRTFTVADDVEKPNVRDLQPREITVTTSPGNGISIVLPEELGSAYELRVTGGPLNGRILTFVSGGLTRLYTLRDTVLPGSGVYKIEVIPKGGNGTYTGTPAELFVDYDDGQNTDPEPTPNRAPTISGLPNTKDIQAGGTGALPFSTSDPDGDRVTTSVTTTGPVTAVITNGELIITADKVPSDMPYSATIRATDGKDGIATKTVRGNVKAADVVEPGMTLEQAEDIIIKTIKSAPQPQVNAILTKLLPSSMKTTKIHTNNSSEILRDYNRLLSSGKLSELYSKIPTPNTNVQQVPAQLTLSIGDYEVYVDDGMRFIAQVKQPQNNTNSRATFAVSDMRSLDPNLVKSVAEQIQNGTLSLSKTTASKYTASVIKSITSGSLGKIFTGPDGNELSETHGEYADVHTHIKDKYLS